MYLSKKNHVNMQHKYVNMLYVNMLQNYVSMQQFMLTCDLFMSTRRLDGQQINRQIFLKCSYMNFSAINHHLVQKNSIYFNFRIDYFVISLYRALHFKEIKIV